MHPQLSICIVTKYILIDIPCSQDGPKSRLDDSHLQDECEVAGVQNQQTILQQPMANMASVPNMTQAQYDPGIYQGMYQMQPVQHGLIPQNTLAYSHVYHS